MCLCICVFVSVYLYLCICICVFIFVYLYLYILIFVFVYLYLCICICVFVFVYLYLFICDCVSLYFYCWWCYPLSAVNLKLHLSCASYIIRSLSRCGLSSCEGEEENYFWIGETLHPYAPPPSSHMSTLQVVYHFPIYNAQYVHVTI